MGLGIVIAVGGAPDAGLATASQVEVVERLGKSTTFRLEYPVDIRDDDMPLLIDARLDQGSELSILASTESSAECLVKGPVHGQRIHLEHGGSGSLLEVLGSDSLVRLDRETRTEAWSGLTDSDVVTAILGTHGMTPDVEATAAGHFEDKHVLVQRATDLDFIRRLARRNGCLFWVTCDTTGVDTGHFKRPPLDQQASDLIINLASPALESLDLEWDVERPTSVEARQLDLNTKSVLDGGVSRTPLDAMSDLGLADITAEARTLGLTAPADDAGDLQARAEGALIEADFFIRARCATTLERLGRVVRAHSVVNLRGAGSRHSGRYLVAAVRHVIDDSAHRMEIELTRNAWGAGDGAGALGALAGLGA